MTVTNCAGNACALQRVKRVEEPEGEWGGLGSYQLYRKSKGRRFDHPIYLHTPMQGHVARVERLPAARLLRSTECRRNKTQVYVLSYFFEVSYYHTIIKSQERAPTLREGTQAKVEL